MNGEAGAHCRIEMARKKSTGSEEKVGTLTSSARNLLFSAELSHCTMICSKAERIFHNIRDPGVAAKYGLKHY